MLIAGPCETVGAPQGLRLHRSGHDVPGLERTESRRPAAIKHGRRRKS
ncbi:hypothetical protein I552_9148 [Mycobacterium xenopi 3993]|nr:hypothetical protein I552_9148 [Mycobacterium xenopi 3993]